MKLTKWSPLVDIGVESPVIPIWISFPNLQPHLFSPRILHSLGRLFGRPLKVDNATTMGPDNFGYIQQVVMKEFPPFCDQYKCLGHSIGACRPIPATISVSGNVVLSNPINANVNSDMNAPSVVEIMDNVTSILPISSINVIVVNEDNGFQTINEVDLDTDNVGLTDEGVDLSTATLSLVLSCNNIEDLNVGTNPCLVNLIARLSPSSNAGGGENDVSDSTPSGPEVAFPVGILVSNLPVENENVGFSNEDLPINDVVILDGEINVDSNVQAPTPLIDIPISLIANDALLAHLAANLKENVVVQGDWLDDCNSASNWDVGEEMDVPMMHSREID
ncbi:hypothetical protein IEQ34_002452 [Dendrobium chrysotoxum]|uniref:DUF4283 domain-containing protein n=1 Tax=Dendrobium chrysotoxum TaxID=161865 RepID=A0AAV7HPM7_DENCH|nr:hypothetical protein IEQ34_002452 [Dendrobium chrysotoxum]